MTAGGEKPLGPINSSGDGRLRKKKGRDGRRRWLFGLGGRVAPSTASVSAAAAAGGGAAVGTGGDITADVISRQNKGGQQGKGGVGESREIARAASMSDFRQNVGGDGVGGALVQWFKDRLSDNDNE